jgi:multidrug resistance efflux pump
MKQLPLWVMVGVLGAAVVGAGVWITRRPATKVQPAAAVQKVRAPEAVAALGQLKPAGEVRRLAAPASGFGGTPRIAALLVKEGDKMADLADSELRSPIDGLVLRVNTREGERPGNEGLIEVGASQRMEALIEVYESDVNRIRLDQPVTLTSENGGFKGTLQGRVIRISPQVRQRQVLSTDPTGDADARVVEVRVKLDSESASRVKSLAGMKVIARFTAQ